MFSDYTSIGVVPTHKPKTKKLKEDGGMRTFVIK